MFHSAFVPLSEQSWSQRLAPHPDNIQLWSTSLGMQIYSVKELNPQANPTPPVPKI